MRDIVSEEHHPHHHPSQRSNMSIGKNPAFDNYNVTLKHLHPRADLSRFQSSALFTKMYRLRWRRSF
jgi:hypothetical protein